MSTQQAKAIKSLNYISFRSCFHYIQIYQTQPFILCRLILWKTNSYIDLLLCSFSNTYWWKVAVSGRLFGQQNRKIWIACEPNGNWRWYIMQSGWHFCCSVQVNARRQCSVLCFYPEISRTDSAHGIGFIYCERFGWSLFMRFAAVTESEIRAPYRAHLIYVEFTRAINSPRYQSAR